MNLTIQVEKWRVYWNSVTDSHEVERQLRKLHWLEEFAFHSGTAISAEQYAALQQQLQAGEAKLCELGGGAAKTPASTEPQPVDSIRPDLPANSKAQRTDFAAERVQA